MSQREQHWTIVLNDDDDSPQHRDPMEMCAPNEDSPSSQSSSAAVSLPPSGTTSPPASPSANPSVRTAMCAPRADALEAASVLLALTNAAAKGAHMF
eukprot:IDg13540t1